MSGKCTVAELRTEIHRLRESVGELTRRVELLSALVCGDGGNGLSRRVANLEGVVERGDASIVVRLARLEHNIATMGWLLKVVLSAVVTTLVVAIVQAVMK